MLWIAVITALVLALVVLLERSTQAGAQSVGEGEVRLRRT